tara:strand:+ start:274765 stop:275028 length:264 start_codon:yes stop_codon:yes gene_type:complete
VRHERIIDDNQRVGSRFCFDQRILAVWGKVSGKLNALKGKILSLALNIAVNTGWLRAISVRLTVSVRQFERAYFQVMPHSSIRGLRN